MKLDDVLEWFEAVPEIYEMVCLESVLDVL